MEILKNTDEWGQFEEVKHLTTNYRRWNDICEYIDQCFDIMEEKMGRA